MPLAARPLFSFVLALGAALPLAASAEFLKVGGPRRDEVRAAVAAHRAEQREAIRQDEAVAGRRLTPAERAQLREQVRSQWPARTDATQTAESAAPGQHGPTPQNAGGGWRALFPWVGSRQ
ncbi:hypothetical protein ACA040_003061 [Xenophilus aerolatus]